MRPTGIAMLIVKSSSYRALPQRSGATHGSRLVFDRNLQLPLDCAYLSLQRDQSLASASQHASHERSACPLSRFTAQQPRLKVGIGRYVDKPTPRARNSSCASASVSSAAIQERRAPSRESRCGPVGGAACRGEGNRHLVRSGLGSHSV